MCKSKALSNWVSLSLTISREEIKKVSEIVEFRSLDRENFRKCVELTCFDYYQREA